MLKLLVYLLGLISAVSIFTHGWLTSVIYSLNAVMQPKYLYKWTFPDIKASMTLAIIAILAWVIAAMRKKIDFSIYGRKECLIVVCMWALIHLSELFSPYTHYVASTSGDIVLNTLNTLVVMYLVQAGLLTDKKQWKLALLVLSGVFVYITLYYVYWANERYLSNNWGAFTQGRLRGVAGSPYRDQNVLSTLVVMGMPFVLFSYLYLKNKLLRYAAILTLPLLWHALFLFGSRGALLGIGVTTLLAALMLEANLTSVMNVKPWQIRLAKLVIVGGLVAAIVYQGGSMLHRSNYTVATTHSESEEPINPRVISWRAAIEIIKQYPVLGVGPQRFQWAARDMGLGTPHVAHNTFFNFSANNGLLVGLLFLYLCWSTIKSYLTIKKHGIELPPILDYLNKACTCSMVGYLVCGAFLDLVIFEPFFMVLLLTVAKNHLINRELIGNDEDKGRRNTHRIRGY